MKSILKYLGMFGLAAVMFTACEQPDIDEVFDNGTMDEKNCVAYMRVPVITSHTWQYRATQDEEGYSFVNAGAATDFKVTYVQLTKPADKTVTVNLEFAQDLLDSLNAKLVEKNGEEAVQYKLFEKSKLNTMSVKIPKGKTEAELDLKLDMANEIALDEAEGHYALPLRIASVSDGGKVSTNYNELMLTFDTSYIGNGVSFSTAAVQTYALQLYGANAGVGKVEGSPRNGKDEWELAPYLRTDYPVSEETTIKLRINPELIESSSYKTDVACPNVKLSKDTFVLAEGESETEPIVLIFPDGMTSMKSGTNYQIPVEIETVTGRGAEKKVSSNIITARITTSTFTPKWVTFTQTTDTYELKFNSENGKVINNSQRISYTTSVKASSAVSVYTYVYTKIDNSLVEKYNKEKGNGTTYYAIENAALYSNSFYISGNQTQSSTSYTVQIQFADEMKSLENGKKYVIPVVLDYITSNDLNVAISENEEETVFYAVIDTKEVTTSMTSVPSPEGTLIDRSAMKAQVYNFSTKTNGVDRTSYIKGLQTSSWSSYLRIDSTTNGLYIDLGNTYTLSCIEFHVNASYRNDIKICTLEVSTDGTTYTVLEDSDSLTPGNADSNWVQYIKLKNPQQCRYLRFGVKSSNYSPTGNYAYLDGGTGKGMNFYEQ